MPLVFSSVFPLCDIATFTSDQSASHAAQGDKCFWPTQEGWLLGWGRRVAAGSWLTHLHVLTIHIPENAPGPRFPGEPPFSHFSLATGTLLIWTRSGPLYVRQVGSRSLVFLSRRKRVSFRHYFHGVVSFCHDLSMDSTRGSWAHMGRLRYF